MKELTLCFFCASNFKNREIKRLLLLVVLNYQGLVKYIGHCSIFSLFDHVEFFHGKGADFYILDQRAYFKIYFMMYLVCVLNCNRGEIHRILLFVIFVELEQVKCVCFRFFFFPW